MLRTPFVGALVLLAACSDPIPERNDGGGGEEDVDLVVVLPFMGPEISEPRVVDAQPGVLDVHFSVDTTASFGDEIRVLQDDLSTRLIPELRLRVNDVAFGVSSFEDFPVDPFGAPSDRPFELLTPITTDPFEAQRGVEALDLGNGSDIPESGYEALYQIATGDGLGSLVDPYMGEGEGGVGFRPGSFRVLVHITDAVSHGPSDYGAAVAGAHSEAEAISALQALKVAVVGVVSGGEARPQMERVALMTSSIVAPIDGSCPTGISGGSNPPIDGVCPQVFDIAANGSGLSDAVEDGIIALLDTVVYGEVYGQAVEDPDNFVKGFVAERFDARGSPPPMLVDRRPAGDGVNDTFLNVSRGTEIELGMLMRNTTVPARSVIQNFLIRVEIVGDDAIIEDLLIQVVVPGEGGVPARVSGGGTFSDGACSAGGSGSLWPLSLVMLLAWRRR